MKKLKYILVLTCIVFSQLASQAQDKESALQPWQKGWMDIHTIATGKGDASFLILPDGTTMLIDAGDVTGGRFKAPALPNDSKRPGEWIAEYIKHFSKGLPHPHIVDYFWLTHFHSDHMGSNTARREGPHYGICGIMEVGEHLRFGHIVDRGYPDYDYPSAEAVANASVTMPDYRKFVEYHRDEYGTHPARFVVGSTKQFSLLNDPKTYKKDFEIWNVACNLEVAVKGSRKTEKMYQDRLSVIDENALSGAILVRYGNFTYFNGGDLGGSPSGVRDMESAVADRIGPVTVVNANHHGWKDTCNPYFMWVTRPDIILIPASHINHPWKDTVRRIYDPQMPGKRRMFCTCDAAKEQVGEELWKNVEQYFGHIVIRVFEGGKSYQVFVLDASTGNFEIIYQSNIEKL